MKNIPRKIYIWWLIQTEAEKAFYLINTPMQIILILAFPLIVDKYANGWYLANPQLFDMLVLPALFGWVFSLFFARWVLGWVLFWYYKNPDLRLPLK